MSLAELFASMRLRFARLFYSFLIVFSFYLLFMSRSGEFRTVWEVIHPAFMITFFVATIFLGVIIFSSERVELKLLFVIVHSILLHSFVVIIFPAGYGGVSQIILGRTRRVFDNIVLHGPWGVLATRSVLEQLYIFTRGTNLQTAFSVVFARMFGVDVVWTHLLLVPMLWGTFVPVIAFAVAKTLGVGKNISVLAGLLVSLFPSTVFWGAVSTPNSMGYLFFFCSIFFSLRYISSGGFKSFFLMAGFGVITFLSHFLTGSFSLSLVVLAIAFRRYGETNGQSLWGSRILLFVSLIVGASVLPFALIVQSRFYPVYTSFDFEKLSVMSNVDVIWLALLGEYVNFDVKTAVIRGIGPLLGILGMVYAFVINREIGSRSRIYLGFLFSVFLVLFVDYRVLKLFMVGVPFSEERLWVMRDFSIAPFAAILVVGVLSYIRRLSVKNTIAGVKVSVSSFILGSSLNFRFVSAAVIVFISLSSLVTASVYYSYPRYAALQTTTYEIEAVKFIETTTTTRYIVICDQHITYAGQMLVGLSNPRAYYFYHTSPTGVQFYKEMKANPTNGPMIEAMRINNSTVAYFVVETSELGYRLPAAEFNRIVSQASLTLKIYGIFGEGKLYIFYYERTV